MALGVDIGPGQLVVVALLEVRRITHRRQFLRGPAVVALGDVGVRQADGHRIVGRAQVFGLGEIALCQIKIVRCQEDVRGFHQVVGRDRRSFANARFGKCQRYFLLGVGKLAFVDKQLGELHAHVNAIGVGCIQGASEPLQRRGTVTQGQSARRP